MLRSACGLLSYSQPSLRSSLGARTPGRDACIVTCNAPRMLQLRTTLWLPPLPLVSPRLACEHSRRSGLSLQSARASCAHQGALTCAACCCVHVAGTVTASFPARPQGSRWSRGSSMLKLKPGLCQVQP